MFGPAASFSCLAQYLEGLFRDMDANSSAHDQIDAVLLRCHQDGAYRYQRNSSPVGEGQLLAQEGDTQERHHDHA